jgi:hypothetical protein
MSSVRKSMEGKVDHAHSVVNRGRLHNIVWARHAVGVVSALAVAVLACLFISHARVEGGVELPCLTSTPMTDTGCRGSDETCVVLDPSGAALAVPPNVTTGVKPSTSWQCGKEAGEWHSPACGAFTAVPCP